jgi:hypothetical protein
MVIEENRYGEEQNFTLEQSHEIIDYVEERLWDEFTQSAFENEFEKIEEMVTKKCDEIANEMTYEIYQMKQELEEQFNLKSKRSFWKWWK